MANFPAYSPQQSGGEYMQNLASIAEFLISNGWSKPAAVGAASTMAGEGNGNPESVGSGGAGIIGWTPPSSARPNPNIVTGNPQADFDTQLTDLLAYAQANSPEAVSRGGVDLQTLMHATDPAQAATWWSEFEGPKIPGSDIRLGTISQLDAMVGNYQPNSAYTQSSAATLTAATGSGGSSCLGVQLPGWLGGSCLGAQVPSFQSIEHSFFGYLERFGLFVLGGLLIVLGIIMLFKDTGPGKSAKQQGQGFIQGKSEEGAAPAEGAEAASVAEDAVVLA